MRQSPQNALARSDRERSPLHERSSGAATPAPNPGYRVAEWQLRIGRKAALVTRWSERLAGVVAAVTLTVGLVVVVARPAGRAIPSPPISETSVLTEPGVVGALTTMRPVAVRAEPFPEAPPTSQIRAGILLPVTERREGWAQVLTPCEVTGWVPETETELHLRAAGVPRALDEATVVVDPGHGGPLPGATGPTGLAEKQVNLEIARRFAARLGDARVFLTRSGDHIAGLRYRTELANRLGAHALVSIHNNAAPDGALDRPGTETFYQLASPASRRLAGLLYEEVLWVLDDHEIPWVGDRDAGAKYRLNLAGADYYALTRLATVPTVLVETMYVSNPPEEAMLRDPAMLDRLGAALARAVERFVTTEDGGSGHREPYERGYGGPSGRLPSVCVDPA